LLNLSRNIGASIGISVVSTLLSINMQTSHQDLGSHVTVHMMGSLGELLNGRLGTAGSAVATMLDAEINRQAAMIAYLDDFKLMMILTLCAVPLVLLLKRPPNSGQMKPDADAMGH
jgi:DHA2 family multidrug resistance protein